MQRIRTGIAFALVLLAVNSDSSVQVQLPDAVNVAGTKAFNLTDIQPGMTLAVVTVKRADGATVALNGGGDQTANIHGHSFAEELAGFPSDVKATTLRRRRSTRWLARPKAWANSKRRSRHRHLRMTG